MPDVSVIMPAYNVAEYVRDAIESVTRQTYGSLELFVVDDGSTDGTLDVARQCAAADQRMRVLRKSNGGISSARNLALQQARGRFIAILDSDDLWEPEYLQEQVAIFEANPNVSIVTGNAWLLGGRLDGQLARPWPDPRPHPDLAGILEDETAVFIMSIFRRELYDVLGGFDESLRTNEDYDYWIRAAVAGFRFHRNDRPLGRYRRRDDSLSADDGRMLRGILRVLEKTRPALRSHPRELQIIERKIEEFETKRLAAEARHAIQRGDFDAAARHLAALRGRTGSPKIQVAWLMARWTPGLLARACQLRKDLYGVAP